MTPSADVTELIEAARQSVSAGLNHGTTGNLSVRVGEGFWITPSGLPCDGLTEPDLVRLTLEGVVTPGGRLPSSEWRLHRDIYRARPEVQSVLHAHPVFATTLACLRQDLPAVHYMLAIAGGATVRCARYATFGTAELSLAVVEALGGRHACLLANHGLVSVGRRPLQALRVAIEVESVAELYWRARQAGTPVILDDAEMARVLDRFREYQG